MVSRAYIGVIREIFQAARQIKEAKHKQAIYEKLVGAELDYIILKDLINAARLDVVINVTLKDGTRLEIKREDSFDRLQRRPSDLF